MPRPRRPRRDGARITRGIRPAPARRQSIALMRREDVPVPECGLHVRRLPAGGNPLGGDHRGNRVRRSRADGRLRINAGTTAGTVQGIVAADVEGAMEENEVMAA